MSDKYYCNECDVQAYTKSYFLDHNKQTGHKIIHEITIDLGKK